MGAKGYVMIKLKERPTVQKCMAVRRKLEEMEEVKSFDCVIDVDWFDILARVEDGIMVKNVATKIQKISGIAMVHSARIMFPPEN